MTNEIDENFTTSLIMERPVAPTALLVSQAWPGSRLRSATSVDPAPMAASPTVRRWCAGQGVGDRTTRSESTSGTGCCHRSRSNGSRKC